MSNPKSEVDYTRSENWLHTPHSIDKPVDVFYLYPTAWARRADEKAICPIDHAGMRKGAQTVFPVQASAFFPVGNVYAPYYRQVDGAYMLSHTVEENRAMTRSASFPDAAAAFDLYLERYNGGRPFLLLSHSQGSATMKELVFSVIAARPEVYEKMIAAYLIGFGVTEAELAAYPLLRFAERADDTNVIISYNTEAPDEIRPNPTAPEGALVINPLSWTREETVAPAAMNLGSLITGRGRLAVMKQFADARVDAKRGTLICSTASIADYGNDPALGTFHSSDIAFYYRNLRENAKLRVRAYFEKGAARPADA